MTNGSRATSELNGAGFSCGFAVNSGVGLAGSIAAAAPSGGLSFSVSAVLWTGFASSTISCMNGIYRSYEVVAHPDSTWLAELDDSERYAFWMSVNDVVGLATSVGEARVATRSLLAALESRALIPSMSELARMSSAERVTAVTTAIRGAGRDAETVSLFRRAVSEASLSRGSVTGAHAALSEHAAAELHRAVSEVVSNFSPYVVNAMPSSLVGSASGTLNSTLNVIVSVVNTEPSR